MTTALTRSTVVTVIPVTAKFVVLIISGYRHFRKNTYYYKAISLAEFFFDTFVTEIFRHETSYMAFIVFFLSLLSCCGFLPMADKQIIQLLIVVISGLGIKHENMS